jgi:hypothetical protein
MWLAYSSLGFNTQLIKLNQTAGVGHNPPIPKIIFMWMTTSQASQCHYSFLYSMKTAATIGGKSNAGLKSM